MAAGDQEAAFSAIHIMSVYRDSVCRGFPYRIPVKGEKSCFKRWFHAGRIVSLKLKGKVQDNLGASGTENMISDYPWARSYEAAILETDRSQLARHIRVAEQAISARERELNDNCRGMEQERSAIRDALSGLRVLRDELKRDASEAAFEFGSENEVAREDDSRRCSQEQK
ncbi:MAG TPA: hypothetical protein VE866_13990 [Candidatus Binatia bacterium]|nr:hypothetical protein [Candidatus Binatia bacterium]